MRSVARRTSWIFLAACFFFAGWGAGPLFSRHPPRISYREPVPVPLPTHMREWRYIVIHHSGAMVGNEDMIQTDHLRRGMENGMAYHFLIGNGSAGLKDGQIVEGHRWKYQLQGGHCHQDFLNEYGIGICLVGNFKRKTPTQEQMKSLSALILKLQEKFHIPDDNIHGHGQFYGEDTDCPGVLFPWTGFWAKLNDLYQAQLSHDTNGAPAAVQIMSIP